MNATYKRNGETKILQRQMSHIDLAECNDKEMFFSFFIKKIGCRGEKGVKNQTTIFKTLNLKRNWIYIHTFTYILKKLIFLMILFSVFFFKFFFKKKGKESE